MENVLILSKFHEKTLRRSGDIKIFRQVRRKYMYTLPAFMEEVLIEERKLMKWVGIFPVGIFWVGIFRVGIFPGEIFLDPKISVFLFVLK